MIHASRTEQRTESYTYLHEDAIFNFHPAGVGSPQLVKERGVMRKKGTGPHRFRLLGSRLPLLTRRGRGTRHGKSSDQQAQHGQFRVNNQASIRYFELRLATLLRKKCSDRMFQFPMFMTQRILTSLLTRSDKRILVN